MVGNVKASGGLQTQLISGAAGQIGADAASGLGDAVNRLAQAGLGYLNSRTDIERVYDQRAQGAQALQLETQLTQYQQDRAKEFTEYSRGRSASPLGMTKEYDAMLATHEEEFLKTVPPRFRDEAKAKLAQDRAQRVGSAFVAELELLDTADTKTLNEGLNTLGSSLKGGSVSLEDAEVKWEETVMKSGLPAETKQQFILSGKQTLQGLEFGTIVEQGALGYGAVSDGSDGSDVSAAGLLPQERGVLNVIASGESPAYNIWNGGTSFEGYEDHPAATGSAPGESTAAGRYQFILGTWRAASASYEQTYGVKVPDFSPEWQDRVAMHWAEKRFNELNGEGLTFKGVLASGDPDQMLKIKTVLGKPRGGDPLAVEWEGLGHVSDTDFIEILTGAKGIAGGGTGAADMPNVWTDPRFANLSLDAKQGFANAAAAAAENQKQAIAQEIKLERDSFLDQAYNAGYSNDPAIIEALKMSQYWDAEAQAKVNAGQEVFRKSENEAASVSGMLSAGTPLSSTQGAAFGKWFGEESFAGIMSGDEKAYAKLKWAVGQARLFPEGSVDAFRAAMGNPETRPGALEFLGMAHSGDSSVLKRSGFSDDDIGVVQLYTNIAGRAGSQEKAMETFNKATDASALLGKTPTAIAKEASDLFTETFPTSAELVDNFDGWFASRPDTSLNPSTEGALMVDARAAFQDGYSIHGTQEGAEAYMQAYLDNTWGVSQTKVYSSGRGPADIKFNATRPVLMKFPPELYYRDYDGASGFVYDELAKFAEANGASPADAVLVSDETTDADVRSGKRPTYRVIGRDEFGGAMVLPGRFGGDELGAIGDESVAYGSSRDNALKGVRERSEEVETLRLKIMSAERLGKPAEEVEALRGQLAKMETGVQASKLAAVENGFLSPDMPQSVDDPRLDDLAEIVTDIFLEDSNVMRKVGSLAATMKGVDPTEARRAALAQLLSQEYKLSPEVGVALMEKVMEKY